MSVRPDPRGPDAALALGLAPPALVLGALRPKSGQRFLEVGCGGGEFFFPVFDAMRGQGVFLAMEWEEEGLRAFLSRLESYADHPGAARVEVVRAKPDRLPLPDGCADLILAAQTYHRLADRARALAELRRALVPGGLLCVVGWRTPAEAREFAAEPAGPGPAWQDRISEAQACGELATAGFPWAVAHAGFTRHWCLTARKPADA